MHIKLRIVVPLGVGRIDFLNLSTWPNSFKIKTWSKQSKCYLLELGGETWLSDTQSVPCYVFEIVHTFFLKTNFTIQEWQKIYY